MPISNLLRNKIILLWMAFALALTFTVTLGFSGFYDRAARHSSLSTVASDAQTETEDSDLDRSLPVIPVYLTNEQRVDKVPLETYVRGVIAAEMPIEFELEALKAQALAARTYIIRKTSEQNSNHMPVQSAALVTDTVAHQAYLPEQKLKEKWTGEDYRRNLEKLDRAVRETEGKILLFQGQPINATFFSTSNGFTENSEDYWGEYIPYLRSVASPWDASLSPRYKETILIPYSQFASKLGLADSLASSSALSGSRVMERSAGQRIKKIRIGSKLFTGREVREKLNLNSSQFEWRMKGKSVEITTTGFGHGVGMSQWGANGMAKEGMTAEQIVKHYYTGIEIGNVNNPSKP